MMPQIALVLLAAAVPLLSTARGAAAEVPGTARVVVFRDDFTLRLHRARLEVNGVEVVRLANRQHAVLELPPGQYSLDIDWNAGEVAMEPLALNAEAGDAYYLRVEPEQVGGQETKFFDTRTYHAAFRAVSPEEASPVLAKSHEREVEWPSQEVPTATPTPVPATLPVAPAVPATLSAVQEAVPATLPVVVVSMYQLLAQPGEFAGRRVRVTGFAVLDGGAPAVYLHEEDYRAGLTGNALALPAAEVSPEEARRLSHQPVVVEATFTPGAVGGFPAALTALTGLEATARGH